MYYRVSQIVELSYLWGRHYNYYLHFTDEETIIEKLSTFPLSLIQFRQQKSASNSGSTDIFLGWIYQKGDGDF